MMGSQQDQCARQAPIVLIVDDNPGIRNVVSWSLHFGGYEAIEATNGHEAIRWIEQAGRDQRYPAVILLDLAMPGMDGNTFLEWVQTTWPSTSPPPAIILVTAGCADGRCLNSYVKQVVAKPFHVRDLLEAIRQWTA
ncbi:MAG TPA: response regulator [Ktedonobacteraceae bacterium]|jgi:CheY-like chemotaxis protein